MQQVNKMMNICVQPKIQDLPIFLLIIGISQMHPRHRFADLTDRFNLPLGSIEILEDRCPFSFRK